MNKNERQIFDNLKVKNKRTHWSGIDDEYQKCGYGNDAIKKECE